MAQKDFVQKLGISPDDEKAITEAIKRGETKTEAEIAVAIVKQSDSYFVLDLFVALCVTLLTHLVFALFSKNIVNFLSKRGWVQSILPEQLQFAFFVTVSLFTLLAFLVVKLPQVKRIFILKKLRESFVRRRAMLHFLESGLHNTKKHLGLLIFVSILERTVYIYPDEGIIGKIPETCFKDICTSLVKAIKEKKAGVGFVTAIDHTTTLLEKHFPIKPDDVNELLDELKILEK